MRKVTLLGGVLPSLLVSAVGLSASILPAHGQVTVPDRMTESVASATGLYFTGPFVEGRGSAGIIELLRNSRMDTAVIDLKDATGRVHHDTAIPELEASAVFSLWRNDFSRRNVTFLRDASGNDVWSGNVRFDGRVYNIANGVFGPQNGEERHLQSGAVLKTKRASGWNAWLVFSRYDVLTDVLDDGRHECQQRFAERQVERAEEKGVGRHGGPGNVESARFYACFTAPPP